MRPLGSSSSMLNWESYSEADRCPRLVLKPEAIEGDSGGGGWGWRRPRTHFTRQATVQSTMTRRAVAAEA